MKQTKTWMAVIVSVLTFSACEKDRGEKENDNDNNHVYTMSNGGKANYLIDYRRAENGTLTYDSSYLTGGFGTGGGLGSQGALIETNDGVILLVNAGSNSISSFKVTHKGLILQSTVNSGGEKPISIAEHNHLVFVLNAGGNGNITGFSLSNNGKLNAITNSTRPLSSNSSGPAQVSFADEGNVVVVTEKATNKIISYTANGTMHSLVSAHPTPFGFAVGHNGNIFVSEAAGGAAGASTLSSYHIDDNGNISLISGPLATNQSAACWVVLTGNGKLAFSTNTASNNISSFNVNSNTGIFSLNNAVAAGTGKGPIDAAVSNNSKFLYVLSPGTNNINCFKVEQNGNLTGIQIINEIAGSAVGLAAN